MFSCQSNWSIIPCSVLRFRAQLSLFHLFEIITGIPRWARTRNQHRSNGEQFCERQQDRSSLQSWLFAQAPFWETRLVFRLRWYLSEYIFLNYGKLPLCCATMCTETSTHQHCLQTMLIQTITQLNIVGREKYLKLGSLGQVGVVGQLTCYLMVHEGSWGSDPGR